jgi:hypothetical protein
VRKRIVMIGREQGLAGGRGRAGLVNPGAGDAAARVLDGGDRILAAGAGLTGGPSRAGLRAGRRIADGTQSDRAGIGHREAGPAGAEMIQVGLGYPLADRHAASALSHTFTVPATAGPGLVGQRAPTPSSRVIYGVALILELHYI